MATATRESTKEDFEEEFLLPMAHAVATGQSDDTIEVSASVPSTYFASGENIVQSGARSSSRNHRFDHEEANEAPYAPAIPEFYNGKRLHNSARDDQLLRVAERKGRICVDEEQEALERNRREIHAIDYHQKAKVQEGNQRAELLERKLEFGLDQIAQTTVDMAEKTTKEATANTTIPQRTEPPNYTGTFGKEYEVNEYNVGENYETQDYEVTEYKSAYDS